MQLTIYLQHVYTTASSCLFALFSPRHVLTALPLTRNTTACSLRFGFGKDNTEDEIRLATKLICAVVDDLRLEAGVMQQ